VNVEFYSCECRYAQRRIFYSYVDFRYADCRCAFSSNVSPFIAFSHERTFFETNVSQLFFCSRESGFRNWLFVFAVKFFENAETLTHFLYHHFDPF
jgi:hypothetical protein